MLEQLSRWLDNLMYPGTVTIQVAKPWCTPARGVILSALQPYHVKILGLSEKIVEDGEGNKLYIEASIRVQAKQGKWAEYLLLRTARFQLLSKPLYRNNARLAARYAGKMPTPWDRMTGRAEPWQEPGCKGKANCRATKAAQAKRNNRSGRKPRARRG